MHSRIIQLEKEIENIERNPMTESKIIGDYDGPYFVGTIADYVSDDVDEDDDIEWFTECLNCFNTKEKTVVKHSGNKITFKKGFKDAFFEERFASFQQTTKEMDIKNFINSYEVYRLSGLIEDKYGFYIYGHDSGLYTLDSFVRYLPDEDVTYHIGTTLDYHC